MVGPYLQSGEIDHEVSTVKAGALKALARRLSLLERSSDRLCRRLRRDG
jgi:hypothetical protein